MNRNRVLPPNACLRQLKRLAKDLVKARDRWDSGAHLVLRNLNRFASASDEEIKSRYHELLFKLHPDTSGTEATRFLLQIVLASYNLIKGERGWKQ